MSSTLLRQLYGARRHPYYVMAPDYRRTSAGIRVMHQLCHALRLSGEEAWIVTQQTHPGLDTPLLTDEIRAAHQKAGLVPIAIYPEVVGRNPLNGRVVVRYLLNRPGMLGETPAYGADDLIYVYEPELATHSERVDGVLHMPSIDTRLFHNRDNPDEGRRSGCCIYFGRYTGGPQEYAELAARCTTITSDFPASREALAALLRRSEWLYCFENTALSMEARLCGCPVVILPGPMFRAESFFGREQGFEQGVAFSEEPAALAQARASVGRIPALYARLEEKFWSGLDSLIEQTQTRAQEEAARIGEEDPAHPRSSSQDPEYATWRARQSLQEVDAEVLAERMVQHWTHRPGIHLILELRAGQEPLLADTLDSLAAQLYPEWLLTVVTVLDKPPVADEIPNLQWLSLRDITHTDYVIDEMAKASPGQWVARIVPGLTLEPQALQVAADYINARPAWRLIYTDEDTLEADGSYSQPLFKPDFNLDLLRAQAYFGSLVLVEKQALVAAGSYGPGQYPWAENYDLSLRVLEQQGEASIGHIDQMLVHLHRHSPLSLNPASEKAALEAHLARCGLEVRVHDSPLAGTRRLEHLWPTTPLVSLIIQTRDREEYLRPLLDSLRERTRYPAWEVVLVDNDSSEHDSLAYLAELQADPFWSARLRIVPCPGDFSYARGANTGARQARGAYLMFLDNDMHIVQDEWLDRLMSHAQRPEVLIVGPRLSYPETGKVQQTGWVLGLRGSAGSPWDNDLELAAPGYMGRGLCDQNVGAIGGSALLIRQTEFARVGGMDEVNFPLAQSALDLCLRVTGEGAPAGAKIVWTPHSMLVHYGSVSLKARQRKTEVALADLLEAQRAHDQVVERWLPRLARDPAYNRHLSLVSPFKPEHVIPMDWDPNFHDRPRILGVPLTGGAGEYRLRAPLRALAQRGLAQTTICDPPRAFTVRVLSPVEVARAAPDSLVLHQPLDDAQSDALAAYARFVPEVKRIVTMDDLITALPKKNCFYKSGFKDARARLRRNLGLADRLVVSTQPLAELCAGMIDDIRVMPNGLESALWLPVQPPRKARRKPRVGWAGAQQHQGDLELIYPVVEALADEVDWIFMGMCPDPLKPFVREAHGFELNFRAYPAALARLDLDLAIAPLEIHAFNEAKSHLRLLEYGAMGWPVVCTDIYPYQDAPVTRLPNDPQRWITTLREMLAEPEALAAAGQQLRQWVLDRYLLENLLPDWLSAYGP
ncbi:MAG: glycosyltransferase [Rhodocyclales bacterium]|nr:glycosyltransferase [Rhodocyclales bacterium]